MNTATRKRLIAQYAKLALVNLREAGGRIPTAEMRESREQHQMSNDQIMTEHAISSFDRI